MNTKVSLASLFLLAGVFTAYMLWPPGKLPEGVEPDRLVVYKSRYRLELWSGQQMIKAYKVSLGKHPIGHKEMEGDSKTPEGHYTIDSKNPNSAYYLNLGISYPSLADRQRAKGEGKNPGGDIKIHGMKNGYGFIGKLHRLINWTDGCIALTNEEMEELYHLVDIGTPIEIKP